MLSCVLVDPSTHRIENRWLLNSGNVQYEQFVSLKAIIMFDLGIEANAWTGQSRSLTIFNGVV